MTAEDVEFSLQRVVLMDKTSAFLLTQLGWSKTTVKDLVKAQRRHAYPQDHRGFRPLPGAEPDDLHRRLGGREEGGAGERDERRPGQWLAEDPLGVLRRVQAASWKANESVSLEAYPGFRLGAPPLKRVVVRHVPEPASQRLLLEKADADYARDLTPDQIKPLASNADIKVESFKAANTFYMGLNLGYEPLANPKVRQAMKMLVDYDGMVKSFLAGRFFVQQSFLPLDSSAPSNTSPSSWTWRRPRRCWPKPATRTVLR